MYVGHSDQTYSLLAALYVLMLFMRARLGTVFRLKGFLKSHRTLGHKGLNFLNGIINGMRVCAMKETLLIRRWQYEFMFSV